MRKIISAVIGLTMWIAAAHTSQAIEMTWEFSVQVSATVQATPAQIALSWPQDQYMMPNSYTVYRKGLNDASWGNGVNLPGTATSYVDNNVSVGTTYEYQIVKVTSQYTSYGYIYSGINVPLTDSQGKLLLVVDNTYAADLANELARLQQDLIGDGWTVVRLDVNRNDSVTSIKSKIAAQYNADPTHVRCLFLFGHVPVPYSGNIVPDGHVPDHQGAWPADGYYGDINGVWTDNSVNITGQYDPRNTNVPGDGKFDQSDFPAPIKLMVGRVDLANMPGELWYGGPTTMPSELELLRNYLNKDHRFRTKQFDLPRRGIVGDFFGVRSGEAMAASGWRNFAPFFGASNVTSTPNMGTWTPTLKTTPYLWAYGCGAGSFTSIAGLGNSDSYYDLLTRELYTNDVQAVFTLFFGSWLGDFDAKDNIMRGVLALPSYGLTCAWSGRPHWFMHHMALGMPIGYSARLTQNNGPSGLYQNQVNNGAGQIHIALMGDPTLRMHVVAPPTNLAATTNNGSVTLNWTGSSDSVVGYHVYRAGADGSFSRLTTTTINATTFTDSTTSGAANYMVRAVKLETSGSGTYYNASEGAFTGSLSGSSGGVTSGGTNSGGTNSGGTTAGGGSTGTNSTAGTLTNTVAWVDDALPAGAVSGADGGDSWNWVSSNPAPSSGSVANQSSIGAGLHEHFFSWATQTLSVNTGDVLYAYVYLDPNNPPSEVMLQWDDNSWEHRAYWGANNISVGISGTPGRVSMGALPAAGQWALLQVPASQVGLEGSTVHGLAFSQYDGRATWDNAGKASALLVNNPTSTNNPPPPSGDTNTVPTGGTNGGGTTAGGGSTGTNSTAGTLTNTVAWVDDALPAGAVSGADGGDSWNWIGSNPAPSSGSVANQSSIGAGLHEHFFSWATQTLSVNTGDVLYAYVYLDPNNPPSEVMLQWDDNSWEHRAYWGANNISVGISGTPGRVSVGALPPAGQWALLQVPASQVGLEGSTVHGLAFSQYDGRATWDNAGKASALLVNNPTSTNNPPPPSGDTNTVPAGGTNGGGTTAGGGTSTNSTGTSTGGITTNIPTGISAIDYVTPELPKVGDNTLHILTPSLLELQLINTKQPDPAQVTVWNFVNSSGQFTAPPAGSFAVTVNGQAVGVTSVGFKRRPLYAPMAGYDLRIENSVYLQLSSPVADGAAVEVKNPDGSLWASSTKFAAAADPLRYSPAIHVNQEGYMPNYSKKARVGFYAGSMGEGSIPASGGFKVVDATSGAQVYQGSLVQRRDSGYSYTPMPYQQVYEADFSSFNTPGEYRLVVPGMGGSLPFLIHDGVAMGFARAYALGLYHQRCGTNTAMPYTRFTHDICHAAPAKVPASAGDFPFTWTTIAGYANSLNANNPAQTAPAMTSPGTQLFPFANQGPVDVSGGHHDAGDYSRYTINSASLVHYLMFAVDSLPGVAALDNLGIPESGDGISDVMQEAKWEADFLAKMQDTDGGFYFLVYPQNREYESNVTPDHGDPQVVWPKTTSVTAASVAALAQCASSPLFKQTYPAAAAAYLQKAKLGWQFLMNAVNKYGKNGAYQKITHYGDNFADNDELAWAACQMYLATGDSSIQQLLLSWFNPADPATWRWGWWHMSECYGHTIRSYAFAVQSGRATSGQLDATFLGKCQAQIAAGADDMLSFSQQNAYGSSFPTPSKAVQSAGWYFSCDQAFDLAVAYQLNPKPDYMTAMLENMNYEGGCNPVNVCYVTGLGWKRQRDIVSQWALNDSLVLPPSGIPVGNIESSFGYLWDYGGALANLSFPSDATGNGTYPFYDRWADSWNVSSEMVVLNQGRGLGTLGFLAAQTAYKTQAWKAPGSATITVPTSVVPVGSSVTATLQVPGMDLSGARVTWEARDQEPAFGSTFTYSPKNNGTQWVQAEAQWPDGRRVFAKASFTANSPNIVWVDDSVPTGATAGADGGDSWNWMSGNPAPFSGSLAHQSANSAGEHQHFFSGATATLGIGTGDVLYAYVYLDANNPPAEVMLQWNDGTWDHRAYWGANNLSYGTDGTPSRYYAGPLPAAGQWVQLKVPASAVNLEGSTLNGMAFAVYNGKATWDAAGRLNQSQANTGPPLVVPVTVQFASAGAKLVWKSISNKTYQVSYKNSLADSSWTMAAQITATGATSAWSDTNAVKASQRFYVVAQTN